jgi:hypothetical protein
MVASNFNIILVCAEKMGLVSEAYKFFASMTDVYRIQQRGITRT